MPDNISIKEELITSLDTIEGYEYVIENTYMHNKSQPCYFDPDISLSENQSKHL